MAEPLRFAALKRFLAWAVPIAVILGGGLWYIGTYYDWVEDKARTGMTGEARKDRYYAAELLLKELGVGGDKITEIPKLLSLDPDTTLILPAPRSLDADQARRLAQWVEAGGHLVVLGMSTGELNRLLDIEVIGSGYSEDVDTAPAYFDDATLTVHVGYTELLATGRPLLWRLTLTREDFILRSSSSEDNEDDEEEEEDEGEADREEEDVDTAKLDSGDAVIHYAHGRGYVTAMGSMSMITNHHIGQNDNAEFLVKLTMLAGSRTVVIAPHPHFPNLIEWLWQRAWPALVALGLLLLAWLWRASPRFGPLEPVPPAARPGLREHLSAVGEFHLKARDFDALVTPLRDDCVRLLQLHAARVGHRGDPAALASRYTGMSEPEIQRALTEAIADRTGFLHCAATLARLRDTLTLSNSSKAGTTQQ
jgi:hypothetical protein